MDIGYIKQVMGESGFLTDPTPGDEWGEPEEKAWRQVCAFTGLIYTPFPTRDNQDPYWIDLIDNKELVLRKSVFQPAPTINPRDLLPAPTKFAPNTPALIMKKHATLLDPELPREIAAQYPHAKKLPAKFTRKIVQDPLQNITPNAVTRKRATQRANPDKSRQLNEVLKNETKRDPSKPIRVR